MKMKLIFVLTLMLMLMLSGCDNNVEYINTGITLDDNEVYYYELNMDVCIALYSTTIELTEDMQYEILYNCNVHTVVLLEDEYISLTSYIKNNLISIEDLLESNLGTPIYYDSIMSILDIDINDFVIDKITIRTLNGEFKDYGGEWTESTDLILKPVGIKGYILNLMATKVKENDICDNNSCVIYGNISPGTIYLKSGNDELRIHFYGNRYEIFYEDEDTTIRIYGITISTENESLKDTIMEVFNNLE